MNQIVKWYDSKKEAIVEGSDGDFDPKTVKFKDSVHTDDRGRSFATLEGSYTDSKGQPRAIQMRLTEFGGQRERIKSALTLKLQIAHAADRAEGKLP